MIAHVPRPPRTMWTVKKILSWKGMDGRTRTKDPDACILVSSLTTNQLHAPCLDLDYPVQFVSAKLAGREINLVCYVPAYLPAEPWERLSAHLNDCGLGRFIDAVSDSTPFRDQSITTEVRFAMRVPMELHRSSNADHRHLYINHEIAWPDYQVLLELLRDCGLIEKGFANASIERKMTMLIRPGLTKQDLEARGIEIEAPSAGPDAKPDAIVKEGESDCR